MSGIYPEPKKGPVGKLGQDHTFRPTPKGPKHTDQQKRIIIFGIIFFLVFALLFAISAGATNYFRADQWYR
ncbi:hypothetical protein KC930_03035 [Candidatus Saccharibacteria bacterium]|nr:hypothetical protein [Candidatus Saccharibacteria bacterium]